MTTTDIQACEWCGYIHNAMCPRVKAIDYDAVGKIRRVEFWSPTNMSPAQFLIDGVPEQPEPVTK